MVSHSNGYGATGDGNGVTVCCRGPVPPRG
jgi:hypothetical protein